MAKAIVKRRHSHFPLFLKSPPQSWINRVELINVSETGMAPIPARRVLRTVKNQETAFGKRLEELEVSCTDVD